MYYFVIIITNSGIYRYDNVFDNNLIMVILEKHRETIVKSILVIAIVLLIAISLYYNL